MSALHPPGHTLESAKKATAKRPVANPTTAAQTTAVSSSSADHIKDEVRHTDGYDRQASLLTPEEHAQTHATDGKPPGPSLGLTTPVGRMEEIRQAVATDMATRALPEFTSKWGQKPPYQQVYRVIYNHVEVRQVGNGFKVYFDLSEVGGGESELAAFAEEAATEIAIHLVVENVLGAFAATALLVVSLAVRPMSLGTGDVRTWTDEEVLAEVVMIFGEIEEERRQALWLQEVREKNEGKDWLDRPTLTQPADATDHVRPRMPQ